jgi:hypothetical protein
MRSHGLRSISIARIVASLLALCNAVPSLRGHFPPITSALPEWRLSAPRRAAHTGGNPHSASASPIPLAAHMRSGGPVPWHRSNPA